MSAPAAFLKVLTEKFRDSGVPWMLTGSAASSYYGEPRATNDLDIVVDPAPAQIEALVAALSGSFYVSRDEVLEALAARGMFNVIDAQSGWKADIIFVRVLVQLTGGAATGGAPARAARRRKPDA